MAPLNQDRKQQIPNYLLGDLSEEEKEDFEREFFEKDDLAAEVLAAEEKLMEDYVSGILDPRRRRQFENIYLANPSHREELKLHESLRLLSGSSRATEHVFWTASRRAAALAACILFLTIGLLLLFRENLRLRDDIRIIQAAQDRLLERHSEPQPLNLQPAPSTDVPREIGGTLPALVLLPGTREAASVAPVLRLAPNAPAYLLIVDVNSRSSATYHAKVETVEGNVLFEAGPLKSIPGKDGRARIQLPLTSSQLDAGDYILALQSKNSSGTSRNEGEYYFRILKN